MTTLALIGKGKWGKHYLEAIHHIPDCEIKYVKTRDYHDLLRYDDIDGIIVATPDATHSKIIQTFPNTFLLVEKPLTTSLEEALRITNTKIMVGYIYLYNRALMETIHHVGKVSAIRFVLKNSVAVQGTTPVWYLASHGVALCVYFFGMPKKVSAQEMGGMISIQLTYEKATGIIEVGWHAQKNVRGIEILGNHTVQFDDSKKQTITPLENELRSFVGFIHGKSIPTGLDFAVNVTRILDTVEKNLV